MIAESVDVLWLDPIAFDSEEGCNASQDARRRAIQSHQGGPFATARKLTTERLQVIDE